MKTERTAWLGSNGTFFADVTGDGRTDTILISGFIGGEDRRA
jgi:hypothetical protein